MLQGVEPEVGQFGYFFTWRPNPEDTTGILRSQVLRIQFMSQPTITTSHPLSLRDGQAAAHHRTDRGRLPAGHAATGRFAPAGSRRGRRTAHHQNRGQANHNEQLFDHRSSFRNIPTNMRVLNVDALCIWSVPTSSGGEGSVLEPLGVDDADRKSVV